MKETLQYLLYYWQPLTGIIFGILIISTISYFKGWNKTGVGVGTSYALMFALMLIGLGLVYLFP